MSTYLKPPFLHRHWKKTIVVLLVLPPILAAAAILYAADQVTSPPRRKVMTYHREFLDHPADHGMRIEPFTANDHASGTPYLVCTPDSDGRLGERGMKIRKQLEDRLVALPPPGRIIGNLVLLHGRTGRKEDYLPVAERLCAVGFRCIIPDLPAHGENRRPFTTYGVMEHGLPEEVLAAAARQCGFAPEPAGLIGMSMGGSFAVHSAGTAPAPWKAMVVLCSFDALEPVVEAQVSGYLGKRFAPLGTKAVGQLYERKAGLALSGIQPARLAGGIRIPTLIAHGTADKVIPMASGRHLYDALPSSTEKRWVEIPGAGHDNLLVTDYPIYAEITEWLLGSVPGSGG